MACLECLCAAIVATVQKRQGLLGPVMDTGKLRLADAAVGSGRTAWR
jgi:hypothetical protein